MCVAPGGVVACVVCLWVWTAWLCVVWCAWCEIAGDRAEAASVVMFVVLVWVWMWVPWATRVAVGDQGGLAWVVMCGVPMCGVAWVVVCGVLVSVRALARAWASQARAGASK